MRVPRTQPRVMRRTQKVPTAADRKKVNQLYAYALEKAEAAKDPRAVALRQATVSTRDRVLKSMGIMSTVDVDREFKS